MLSNDFLLKETRELETEIERHCAGLGLDCTNVSQIRQFAKELLLNIGKLKEAAGSGDHTARAKVELFGMVMLLHEANIKTYGSEYMTNIKALVKRESAWVTIANAMWNDMESRKPGNE